MSFDEAKTGLGMIERRIGPFSRPVAGVALFAIAPLMVVLDAVTVDTAASERVFEVFALVTVIALQARVRVGEWKAGCRVIESNAAPC